MKKYILIGLLFFLASQLYADTDPVEGGHVEGGEPPISVPA